MEHKTSLNTNAWIAKVRDKPKTILVLLNIIYYPIEIISRTQV